MSGYTIDADDVEAAEAWILRQSGGFTFGELQSTLMQVRVPYAVRDRAADRILQKLRRSGAINFYGGYWHVIAQQPEKNLPTPIRNRDASPAELTATPTAAE